MLEHRVEHQLLIALMDNIPELVVFFNSDREIILFNQKAKIFFNIDPSQITNLRLSDLANTLKIDQLTIEPIKSLKEKLPIEQIETTYTANNTANYIIWSIYDLKQQYNENDIFILLGKNVTDLKNLSSNMEKLDNIIKYAPEMIYWKNTNSIYLGCNDQFAFAANLQDRNDIIGKSDYELPWYIQAKKFCSDDKEVIVTGNPKLNIEDLLPLKDDKQRIVITNKVPLRDLNGVIIGVLGIATDITERKKSETALQQSKSTQEELERLNNIIRYANHTPILIAEPQPQYAGNSLKTVDAIWLDDDITFTDSISWKFEKTDKVDIYRTPAELMQNIYSYVKDTLIFLDNNFEGIDIHGTDIAIELHKQGFTKLFLLSGDLNLNENLSFLTILPKHEANNLKQYWKKK